MTSSVYISNFSESVFNPDTDFVLSITPDNASPSLFSARKSKITYVPTSSYSVTSSCALSFVYPFNQDLNTTNSVVFNDVSLSSSLVVNDYTFPSDCGEKGQIIVTDGSGSLYWSDFNNYTRQFSTRSLAGQQSLLSQIVISVDESYYYRTKVIGVSDVKTVGIWDLKFCVKNINNTSSFVGDIMDDDLVNHTTISESVSIYKQSNTTNLLPTSHIDISIVQPDKLLIYVTNPNEVYGSYGTNWTSVMNLLYTTRLNT